MITESDVYRACIVLSIAGLSLIYVSHSYLEPQTVVLDDVDETMMGDNVKTVAEITRIEETENAAFLDIRDDSGEIDAVDFESHTENLEEGQKVEIEGYIDVYQGRLQIIVEEIRKEE